jgi:Fic family protein/DNA-binding XRE family transcriptional regulator
MTNFVRLLIVMKKLLKNAREKQNLLIREVAEQMHLDPALVSKWEKGTRKPTREQIAKLAKILDLDLENLLIEWMSEVILYEIGNDELAHKALKVAEEKIKYNVAKQKKTYPTSLQSLLDEIDTLKSKLTDLRMLDSYRIAQALELEYTFESNRIEGNTLTLKETDLVINEGITISGKSMREHLEAINHTEAVEYLKYLVENKNEITERDVLQLHNLILRGIDSTNAGIYRKVQVMIKGSKHLPPQPYLVPKQMEELFEWYNLNKNKTHPVILAAEMSERLVTIHPFIDGNGRSSRLLMNLILLKNGYVIANIKGDNESRMKYYQALESVQVNNNKIPFHELVAQTEKDSLLQYLKILGQ